MGYADLEALDTSKLDETGGKEALAKQVVNFIDKNGNDQSLLNLARIADMPGFFYVKGHGLSSDQIRKQYALAGEFFGLPEEKKIRYLANTAAGDFRGYKPISTGKLGARDNDERYNIPKFTPEHERPHPQLILDHFEEIREFALVS